MVSKRTFVFFILFSLLISTNVVTSTKKHIIHKKKVIVHVPEPEPCKEDKGEAAGLIREAILAGDFEAIAKIFQTYCGEANLARGFDFEGSEDLLQPTEDRVNDPDIVSFKALALHSIETKEYDRLADIFLFALFGNDLITLETDYKCSCKEEVVDQKVKAYTEENDKDHNILAKYKAEVTSVKNSTSMWKIDAAASTTTLDYNDPDAIGCHWEATIKVSCKDVSKVTERGLTDEEIAEKKNDLIADFSDEAYMQSIVDNSYFDDLVEPNHRRRKLAMRELLLTNAQSVVSSICYVCDPKDTCSDQLSDC